MLRIEGFIEMLSKAVLEKIEPYNNWNNCHISLPHCHCMYHYCENRDECEYALFDSYRR